MIPIATDKLKNNCPSASIRTVNNFPIVSPSKLGTIYTLNPCRPVTTSPASFVFFNVNENIAIPKIMTSRIGMIIFDVDSIPLLTPRNTINADTARKITNVIIGSHCDVMNPVKNPSCAASAPCPVKNTKKYFTTQPPIVQ